MNQDEVTTITEPKYFKAEEHRVETHEEATILANSIFQPFATESHQAGDRTTEAAKVRIRCRHTVGDFRVVLYRAISSTKSAATTENTTEGGVTGDTTDDDAHSKKQTKAQRKKATKEAARTKR